MDDAERQAVAPLLEKYKSEFSCQRAHVYEERPYRFDAAGKFTGFLFSAHEGYDEQDEFRQLSFVLPVIDDELIEDIDGELLHNCRQASVTDDGKLHGLVLLDSGLEIEVQHGKLIDHPGDAFTPPAVRPLALRPRSSR